MPQMLEHRETGKLAVQVDVAVENIGEGLPQETIKATWEKASDLIRTPNAISGVPGGNPKDRYVFSRSDGQPHFVEGKSSGIYKCDERCMHFKSIEICSQTVAVANIDGDLPAYVAHVSNIKGHPNLFHLSKHGMPPGAGKKGGQLPRSKSKRTAIPLRTTSLQPATSLSSGPLPPELTPSSSHPSAMPRLASGHPSAMPTLASGHPSAMPTLASGHPSATPTLAFGHPSAMPTLASGHPLAMPTPASGHPSATPTLASGHPSATPTLASSHPSATPTLASGHPSATPTLASGHPSATPTLASGHPSATPTLVYGHPSATPTPTSGYPSAMPSLSFSYPSATPSHPPAVQQFPPHLWSPPPLWTPPSLQPPRMWTPRHTLLSPPPVFTLIFRKGNICVCYGCKGNFAKQPAAPHDLVIQH